MKTCKYGCGKMKEGGKVATVKKMTKGGTAKKYAAGGSTIVGMPQYPNNPRTYSGRMLKEGGSFAPNRSVMESCKNGMVRDFDGKCVNERSYKKGGATKNAKLAALATPRNKVTRADVIAGALKNKRKKK